MIIKRLTIENFRNLAEVEIRPHRRINVIFGDNGAGKTSILESLVVLARGRSFRTTQAGDLSGPKGSSFRVFAETQDDAGVTHRMGIERSGSNWRAKKDGRELNQLSQLTRYLPLILMEPNSHLLVSGPPEVRRRFIDWGMFHVEHGFLDCWRRYSKSLKQRNAALRRQQLDVLDSLDDVLVEHGSRLGTFRKSHSKDISARIHSLLQELDPGLEHLSVEYHDGWNGSSLRDSLVAGRERDLERGLSGSGPHRADLGLYHEKTPARSILSRGEQKTVAAALLMAQAEILAGLGEKPVVLLDDLASEFDRKRYERVLQAALERGAQVWVSGTRKPVIDAHHSMFHVERGLLEEVV